MGYTAITDNIGVEDSCYSDVATPPRSEDHLLIPFGVMDNTLATRATRFCGTSLDSQTVTSNTPGPFVIYFNSDDKMNPANPEIGFRLEYTII